MNTYWMTITPQVASEWLQLNERNRPVKDAHVRYLAQQMVAGRWKANGETIKRNGSRLLDGQHRLMACVKANTPFRTLVVEGLDYDVVDTVDEGCPRTAGDTLAMAGEKSSKRLAAALKVVDQYLTGRMESRTDYSNAEVEQLLAEHPEIRSSVNRSDFNQRLIAPSLVAAMHYLCSKKDQELAERFFVQLLKGNELKEVDPCFALRERLMKNSLSKAKLGSAYIAALLIKAWNHTRQGNSIKHLRYRENGPQTERFPVIV